MDSTSNQGYHYRVQHRIACLLGMIFIGWVWPFQGTAAPRVVLVNDPTDLTIMPRLRSELSELGFDIREVEKQTHETLPHDLIEAARRTESIVGFRVQRSNDQVDVWIADRVTGKVVFRELLSKAGGGLDERVVALRAVELLRVSLMELAAPHQSRGEVIAPAEVQKTSALWQKWGRYSFEFSPVALWSPGGSRPGMGAAATFSWQPSWCGTGLTLGSVLEPARFTGVEGQGEITTRWAAFDLSIQPRLGWHPGQLNLAVGAAVLASNLRGISQAPRTASQGSMLTMAPTIRINFGWLIHRNLQAVINIRYLRPLKSARIIFDSREVGLFGEHIFIAALGLAFIFP